MIIGDTSRFAVQWDFESSQGHFLFGRMCYWVGNLRVGDYQLGATLSDAMLFVERQVCDIGKRQGAALCALDAGDAYSTLYRGLFESDESLRERVADEQWARYDISLPIDVFDGWRLYLVDCQNCSRLLVGRWNEKCKSYQFVKGQQLALGEFDHVISRFADAVRAIDTGDIED